MKDFLHLFRLETIRENLKKVLLRFPLPVAILVLITATFLVLIHVGGLLPETIQMLGKIIFSLIVVFFLAVWMKLFCEAQKKVSLNFIFWVFFPLCFGGLFYFFLKNDLSDFLSVTYIIVTLLGVVFLLFFAPYGTRLRQQNFSENSYYTYFYSVSTVFLLSFIFGGILTLLGFIGIHTVYTLFDLSFLNQGKIFSTWAALSLSFITPIFALIQLPWKKDFFEEYFNENVFFSFLVRYVAIPFIFVYFIILYMYSLKVLLDFGNWPRGEVSWMVIGFSIFWYVSYIFSYIFEGKNKFIELFRKYFPYVVLPQLAMLFYAIYLRITQYDLTINRYLVVVFGIWLSVISLYFIFSKGKKLVAIPSIITLFTIIVSIGPWSLYSLPYDRQTTRLKENLVKARICEDNLCHKIIPLKTYEDIDAQLSKNIYSWIEYICKFENCERVKKMFPKIYADIEKTSRDNYLSWQKEAPLEYRGKFTWPSNWEIISGISEAIKVRNYTPTEAEFNKQYFSFYSNASVFPLDLEWYTKMYEVNLYKGNRWETEVSYDRENKILSVAALEIDMKAIFTQIISEATSKEVFRYSWDGFDLIVLNASMRRNGDVTSQENMHGYILVK